MVIFSSKKYLPFILHDSICRQVSSSGLHYALHACEVGAQWQLALELGRFHGRGAMAALVAGEGGRGSVIKHRERMVISWDFKPFIHGDQGILWDLIKFINLMIHF